MHKDSKLSGGMELFEGVVVIENENFGDRPAAVFRFLRIAYLYAHLAAPRKKPIQAQFGVVKMQTLQKIVPRLVPARENVGDTGPRDLEGVGELGLGNVFGLEKLLQAAFHIVFQNFHKSNTYSSGVQIKLPGRGREGEGEKPG